MLTAMKTITLWCEVGQHEWERESQRGRRPTSCPEHVGCAVPEGAEKPTTSTVRDTTFDAYLELGDHPSEARRILHYIATQLASGRQDPSLVQRGREILREIERGASAV